ncbi:transglycosylase domain-containing protein [Corynebacterium tapiri]|uniref:transglycosylase domain-containing protein n=1 Tax=Corynebacterium tapiri TaxID=1448266 RepID=UPI003CCC474F
MSHSASANTEAATSRPWLKWLLGALAALFLLPLIIFVVYYFTIRIPEPNEVSTAQVSHIYASDSTTELARIVPPEGNRTQVGLDKMPDHLQNAVLAAEDREFWSNSGFSVTGFSRAILGQITGNDAGGGSTITQQYVKNVIVGNERSVERKLKELVYSIKMTNEWDKEQILQAYLNTVYFGRNAYGVQAASQAYFGKDVSQLTPEESAVLAGAIQLPSQLDPWTNPEGSKARWDYVMDGLVEMGEISPEERAAAEFPQVRDPSEYSAYTEATGTNGLIKNHVMEELATVGITEEDVTTRGLQVTTTIDMQTQNATMDSVNSALPQLQDDARAAVVSIEPSTGAIRGYYGGEEASGWDYANAGLQTGSIFKIFGLAAALQQGIPLSAQYSSSPVTLPGSIEVDNVTGSCGTCSIETALVRSYNTSFIRLQDDLANTTQDTADMAHALGVARSLPGIEKTLTENGKQPYEGVILGQYQSRPLDMAVAMATLANRGVWHQTHWVDEVKTANGEVLYKFEPGEGERRVSAQVADNVLKAMGPIAGWSNGKNLAGGRPSASKTGTAQLGNTGANKDAWMLGGTPQLVTAVWMGTAENTNAIYDVYGGNMYGSGTPATIWKQTLDGALEGKENVPFHQAAPINFGGFSGSSNYTGSSYAPQYDPQAPVATRQSSPSSSAEAPTSAEASTAPAPEPVPGQPAPGQPAPGQPAPGAPAQPAEPAAPPAPDPLAGLEQLLNP